MFPPGGHQGRHQQLHQGGFTRPVGAQQADEAGGFEVQVQPFQGLFPAGVGHADVLNFEFHSVWFLSAWDVERITRQYGGSVERICDLCGDYYMNQSMVL